MVETLAALLLGLVLGIWHGEVSRAGGLVALGGAAQPALGPVSFGLLTLGSWALAFGVLFLLVIGRGRIRPLLRLGAIAIAVVPLASAWSTFRTPVPHAIDPAHWAPLRHAVILGTIASEPRRLSGGWRFELKADRLLLPYPSPGDGRILVRSDVSATEPLRYGQRVRLRGSLHRPPAAQNPGEFDYRAYLARQGVFTTMTARDVAPLLGDPEPSVVGRAVALKNEALALLGRHLPEAQAALLGSLLFGDGASPIDPETAESFRALGLAHVLAVSGAQILFLWGMLRVLIVRLGLPRWAGVLGGCAGLWGYAFMTGLPPSVIRATWMGCALILGWAVERPWLRYLSLQIVVLGMLVYRPGWLFDAGFQFSAIATFALLHTAPKLLGLFRRLPESLAQAFAMALAAGVWVLPLQIAHFGQFSPYSLPLNALTCFLVEAVTVLGFLAVLAGSISDLLAHHLLSGTYLLLKAFTGIVAATLPLPGSSQFLRTPPAWWLGVAYLCLIGALAWRPPAGRSVRHLPLALAVLPLLAYGAWEHAARPHDLEVTMLSIGQGDALVIRTPAQRWYLIDGGPCWDGGDVGERTILPYLRRQGCRRLDGIILSHAHDDHVGGLAAVTEGMPVGAVWDAGEASTSSAYQRWLEQVLERRIPLIRVQEGMRTELETHLSLDVLGPPAQTHRGSRSDANNNSVVLMLRHRSFSMLFAGDMEAEAEARLLQRAERLRATVLKVAHHGSRYGSKPEFLRAVRPQASLISVGARNTFGHPAHETLARLRPYGRVYRTDLDGTVTVRSDGERWSITTLRD